jgi:hypothetical protein
VLTSVLTAPLAGGEAWTTGRESAKKQNAMEGKIMIGYFGRGKREYRRHSSQRWVYKPELYVV